MPPLKKPHAPHITQLTQAQEHKHQADKRLNRLPPKPSSSIQSNPPEDTTTTTTTKQQLAMDMGRLERSTSSSTTTSASSSSSDQNNKSPASFSSSPQPPKKRPAGRTKFRETRHPVFRGVRRRGAAGRWVCEVRVPGNRGARLWLGTYLDAESAARAHDAAMLALGRGRSGGAAGAGLNFPDSAWLLAVPPPSALSTLDDARRAALEAVSDFQRRFDGAASAATASGAAAVDEVTSGVSAPPPLPEISCSPAAPTGLDAPATKADEPAALDVASFETDWFGDMDLDMYYASLAEGLLMEPPPAAAAWEHGDLGDGGADVALWSY